ncbi:MAG TPA: M15 family metallopeptidase [Candidatus Paceibacterota bacterium]|nr:M15 family metallopeptidase [Candidatus Paceibacterota bacterium]
MPLDPLQKLNNFLPQDVVLQKKITTASITLLSLLVVGGGTYGFVYVHSLSARVDTLSRDLASTTYLLQETIAQATSTFADTLAVQGAKLGDFENAFDSISGTVDTLQKLTTTDKELLAKYSKVFFLSDNYAPARLIEIPAAYNYSQTKTQQLVPDVIPFLTDMIDAAKDDGVELYVQSAYRSFNTQEALKGQYTVTYGAGSANSFSADQGYSEHQLGTAVDVITTGTGGRLDGFDKTAAYAWMLAHAYRYGFILSYPQGNQYYVFEPWHWRFVGRDLSTYLHKQKKNFYDMDQRQIDTYLPNIFD